MQPTPAGLLNVLKPPGMTSHDVVAVVRRLVDGKVGHTGTLDPLAAGVLVLTVGAATRLTDLMALDDKSYRADIILGLETTTLDLEGEVTARADASAVTRAQVEDALEGLTGEVEMTPPAFSAIKRGGRPLHELARAGKDVQAPPRKVRVHRFTLLEFTPGPQARCLCDIHCSKGTYVRSLAQMVGERLECGGCLGFLLRTSQGPHAIHQAHTLEEVAQLAEAGALKRALVPLAGALPDFPTQDVDADGRDALRTGRPVPAPDPGGPEGHVMVVCGQEAICIAEAKHDGAGLVLHPRRVFT